MSAGKRPSIAEAIHERMASPADKRKGMRYVTFPIAPAMKVQLIVMSARLERSQEDLMREALHDLMLKHGFEPPE